MELIKTAIWHLQSRYSLGGIAAFALSVMLSIGLVVFGIAHQPATSPGLPAEVQRSVVYPAGDIPVPGPSLGPSKQDG